MISIQLWSLRDAITGLGWGSVLDAVAAAGAGVSVMVHPSFTADRRREADGIQRIAADLNHAAGAAGPRRRHVRRHVRRPAAAAVFVGSTDRVGDYESPRGRDGVI